jgi:hypothetical protein
MRPLIVPVLAIMGQAPGEHGAQALKFLLQVLTLILKQQYRLTNLRPGLPSNRRRSPGRVFCW